MKHFAKFLAFSVLLAGLSACGGDKDKQAAATSRPTEQVQKTPEAENDELNAQPESIEIGTAEDAEAAANTATTEGKLMTLDNGLKLEFTEKSNGAMPQSGDTVLVHYTGKLIDGTIFDSSLDRGQPFKVQLGEGRVIKGWEQGLLLIPVGSKATLTIPPDLGYGSHAKGPIPPNSTLIFELHLLEIVDSNQ